MIPVVTVGEMRSLDELAHQDIGLQVLVERAGYAVGQRALLLLGGAYGRRILVIAGKGNNGEDGRVAAGFLMDRGAVVDIVPPDCGEEPDCVDKLARYSYDLVIDAAYGTGFHGTYHPPVLPAGIPVLAVDIPSGVYGDTGESSGSTLQAIETVVMAALKPGLIQSDGAKLSGRLHIADIGIDPSQTAKIHVIEDRDVVDNIPVRDRDAHKWMSATCIVAGSSGMMGAALLCASGALRAGAGMVRLATLGERVDSSVIPEVVKIPLGHPGENSNWSSRVIEEASRCKSLVIGPGLGRSPEVASEIRKLLQEVTIPLVVDADGLYALGSRSEAVDTLHGRNDIVLTPHDGEAARLAGHPIGNNRIEEARSLSSLLGVPVLLKGPTTVVADPEGDTYVVISGTPRLASAGSGDVLSGIIGGFIARRADDSRLSLVAALAAYVHGQASRLGKSDGLVAMDIPELVAEWMSTIELSNEH